MGTSFLRGVALAGCLALAACNGTALVTLTATPALTTTPASVTGFLTYRVRLVSVELQDAGGATQSVLPAAVSMDLAQVAGVSEIISAATVRKGNYTRATIRLDYGNGLIVGDDGTPAGVTLTPQDTSGNSLGALTLTLLLDTANPLRITTGGAAQLALDFRLAASNGISAAARTVTVTPLLIASAQPIDAKPVRVRGPLKGTDITNANYTAAIEPFDGLVSGAGSVRVAPTTTTTYEIGGVASTGSTGFTSLSGLGSGSWTVAYGTLSATTSTSGSGGASGTATATTRTNITLTPTQVLAGASVQGGGLDRLSGVVTARNGNTLTLPTATWITSDGVPSFVSGAATITLGTGTGVTTPGQGAAVGNTPQQISVGSVIDAFGTTTAGGGQVALDASAGRVRLGNTVAAGSVVAVPGAASLSIDLATLGGRPAKLFDFTGTAVTSPAQYRAATTGLNSGNAFAGADVELTGLVASYGAAPPDFNATALLDPTTINAELVLEWAGPGSAAPFASLSTTQIDLPVNGSGLGLRHQIAVGRAATIDVTTLVSDLLISPSASSTQVFAIAHQSTASVENFNTFAAFITALQGELDGTTVATTLTAEGIYTAAGTTLAATSITIHLNI